MVERGGLGGFAEALPHAAGDGAGEVVLVHPEVACGVAQRGGCGIGHCTAGRIDRGACVNEDDQRSAVIALAVTVDVSAGVAMVGG